MSTKNLIDNDWDVEERRAYERYSVEFYLCVYNQDDGSLVGHVVDISLGGLQLLSENPVASGEEFRFRMELSLESGRKESINFQARNVWQDEDVNLGSFNVGFEFIHLTPAAQQSLEAAIQEMTDSL
ncbi:MAG: PilZ domain-containing protein [Candidatus Competibacter sp.]